MEVRVRDAGEKRLEGVDADAILKGLSPEVIGQLRRRLAEPPAS